MKVEEQNVVLRKLIASEGKVIVPIEEQYDEEGNLIEQKGVKEMYLAVNDSEENYKEIAEEERQN